MTGRFFWLLFFHCLFDYALQPKWMCEHKRPSPYSDPVYGYWWWSMSAHCLLNAGGVYLVTQSWLLTLAEFVIHFTADTLKAEQEIGTGTDQAVHIVSKFIYSIIG